MDEKLYNTEFTVQSLINELSQITAELDILEARLLIKLNEEDEQAQSVFDEAIKAATSRYKTVGEEIYKLGGITLMQHCIYSIPNRKGAHSVINLAWSGIGSWRV
jgi:hypothetical protein